MARAQGFLSYTHIDDEFFSGAITALRHFLELGVQVVTGDREFRIFQDREGIELGQQWQKRLEEAIASASLLIPVLTPCFFRSEFCRDELTRFLRHEAALGRDDLILPIYFVTVPSLEKRELMEADQLAKTIAARQRFDWRAQADLPLTEVQVRRAARELCERIAAAIERTTAAGAAGAGLPPAPRREFGTAAFPHIAVGPLSAPGDIVLTAGPKSAHARATTTATVVRGGFSVSHRAFAPRHELWTVPSLPLAVGPSLAPRGGVATGGSGSGSGSRFPGAARATSVLRGGFPVSHLPPAPRHELWTTPSLPLVVGPRRSPRGSVVTADLNSAYARAARAALVLRGGFPVSRLPPAHPAATPLTHGDDTEAEISAAGARLRAELSGKEQAPARWSVLWVDDKPGNNRFEASALREYGVQVTQATSTEQALALLDAQDAPGFGAVISDMSRPPDRQAGYTLLRALRAAGRDVPFFIYARARDARRAEEARRRGGQGYTDSSVELVELVLRAVGATKGRQA